MSRSAIFLVDADGGLTAMKPAQPRSEDHMQSLVAAFPEIIADRDGPLLLIRREQPVNDVEGARWSVDHLFVTRAGVPVLVELKRAVDTRLRREVAGQMLDYAANATAYWQPGRIAESFAGTVAARGQNPEQVLGDFLGSGADPLSFWDGVDANMAAGRIKMVFVADTIPRELTRIVEFMNDQMRAEVRAVELSWFESANGVTALTPRIIGETERSEPASSPGAWIDAKLSGFGPEVLDGSMRFLEIVEGAGGAAQVARTQGSVLAVFAGADGPLYPLLLAPSSRGSVQLCLGYLAGRAAFADEAVRRTLYDRLASIVGNLSTSNLAGYPAFGVALLNNDRTADALAAFLSDLITMGHASN